AGGDPLPVDPVVDAGGGHVQRGGEVGDRPFVRAGRGQCRRVAPARLDPDAVLVEQVHDLGWAEPAGAFGWAQTVGVGLVGDLAGGVALRGEVADPGDQLRVVRQLVQAGDRTHGLALGFVAAGPGDGDVDQLAVADDRDGDLLDDGTQDLFAVADRCGGC